MKRKKNGPAALPPRVRGHLLWMALENTVYAVQGEIDAIARQLRAAGEDAADMDERLSQIGGLLDHFSVTCGRGPTLDDLRPLLGEGGGR